ncbi:proline-serine-threonine phosphatase interacting protein 1 [Sarotherodon galilaeus]
MAACPDHSTMRNPVSSQNRNPISVPDLNETLPEVSTAQKPGVSRYPPSLSSPSSACFHLLVPTNRSRSSVIIFLFAGKGLNQTSPALSLCYDSSEDPHVLLKLDHVIRL